MSPPPVDMTLSLADIAEWEWHAAGGGDENVVIDTRVKADSGVRTDLIPAFALESGCGGHHATLPVSVQATVPVSTTHVGTITGLLAFSLPGCDTDPEAGWYGVFHERLSSFVAHSSTIGTIKMADVMPWDAQGYSYGACLAGVPYRDCREFRWSRKQASILHALWRMSGGHMPKILMVNCLDPAGDLAMLEAQVPEAFYTDRMCAEVSALGAGEAVELCAGLPEDEVLAALADVEAAELVTGMAGAGFFTAFPDGGVGMAA